MSGSIQSEDDQVGVELHRLRERVAAARAPATSKPRTAARWLRHRRSPARRRRRGLSRRRRDWRFRSAGSWSNRVTGRCGLSVKRGRRAVSLLWMFTRCSTAAAPRRLTTSSDTGAVRNGQARAEYDDPRRGPARPPLAVAARARAHRPRGGRRRLLRSRLSPSPPPRRRDHAPWTRRPSAPDWPLALPLLSPLDLLGDRFLSLAHMLQHADRGRGSALILLAPVGRLSSRSRPGCSPRQ
jgi:hypothetical protein